MRFILVLCIWIVIIGGVYTYTVNRDRHIPTTIRRIEAATLDTRNFSLEITPTFTLEKDPFALSLNEEESLVEVLVNGRSIQVNTEQSQAGQIMRVEHIAGLVEGANEIFIEASPPNSDSSSEYGLRLKVLEDTLPVAETTLWSNAGSLVSGSLHFDLTDTEDAHDN